jgi:methylated-DNA-[protein]-cysteine S-methyltransferase
MGMLLVSVAPNLSLAQNRRMDIEASACARPFDGIASTPFGAIGVRCAGEFVTGIEYLERQTGFRPHSPLAKEAIRQLAAYLADADFSFDLPLKSTGTAFQHRVWEEISAIPRGTTRTYGNLAASVGSAPRAVGQACGANPLPIVVPCHRVVAASKGLNGGLGGFARTRGGFLVDVKRWLLRHEGALQDR